MYYCYFNKLKTAKMKHSNRNSAYEIDEAQCKKLFDFKTVEANILVLEEELSKFTPLRMKSFWFMMACLVELFILSWQLTLAVIGGGALLGIFYMFTEYFYLKMEKKSDNIKEALMEKSKKAFKTEPINFSKTTNAYDECNEDLFTSNKKESCCLAFNKAVNLLMVYVYQILIVFYCVKLYEKS